MAKKSNLQNRSVIAVNEALKSLGYMHIGYHSSTVAGYIEADGGTTRMLVYLVDKVEMRSPGFNKALNKLQTEAEKQNREPWIARFHAKDDFIEWLEPIDFE